MMFASSTIKHLDQASRAPIGTDERTRLPLVNTSGCGNKRDTAH